MAKPKTGELELIQYYREKRPPTLKQFIHRKYVSLVMSELKGNDGVIMNPKTGKDAPISAIRAREMLQGKKSEEVMAKHPEWIEEYKEKYPDVDRD